VTAANVQPQHNALAERTETFARRVRFERARLAAEDPAGEADAVAPLSEVRARQILLEMAEEDDVARRRRLLIVVGSGRPFDPLDLLRKLDADLTRDRGMVRCPSHEDSAPSLSWRREGDQVLIHCFANCTFDEIRQAVA